MRFCALWRGATSPNLAAAVRPRDDEDGADAARRARSKSLLPLGGGTRKPFQVAEATAPLLGTFTEDYLVEERSPSSCRFTWTIASETPPAARPGNPINRLIIRSLFRDTRRHFGVG
jgi:hypothetical protein